MLHDECWTNATRRNHFSTIFDFVFFSIKINNKKRKLCFSIFVSPEGNFDIDAGDGGWGGPFRTPKSPKTNQRTVRTKCAHTSGTSFKNKN